MYHGTRSQVERPGNRIPPGLESPRKDLPMSPCALAPILLALTGPPSPEPAPRSALPELAWMAGEWVDEQGANLTEEIWAAPAGDSMMGMWRLVSGGRVKLFEFLTLVQEEQGPVFRLRHFDRKG